MSYDIENTPNIRKTFEIEFKKKSSELSWSDARRNVTIQRLIFFSDILDTQRLWNKYPCRFIKHNLTSIAVVTC